MGLLRFWKSESRSGTLVPGRKRQRSKSEFLRTRSALFLSNGCATGSKQQAWNLRKARPQPKLYKRREVVVGLKFGVVFLCDRCVRCARTNKWQRLTRFLTTPAVTLPLAI